MSYQIKSTDTLRIVRCSVGSDVYGLDTSWILSIQRVDRLRHVSAKKANTAGFVGWLPSQPSDIPVFSLADRLGQEDVSQRNISLQRIIVLPAPAPPGQNKNQEDHLWALLVDQVSQVFSISGERFHPMPAVTVNPKRNYFEGVLRTDDGLLLFLSPEWLHPDTSLYTDGIIEKHHSLEAQLNDYYMRQVKAEQRKPSSKNSQTIVEANQQNSSLTSNGNQSRSKQGRLVFFVTNDLQINGFPLIYGLSITQVSEILYPIPVTPVPAAPEYVLGLVNWRNRIVPIVDLNARLGLASTDTLNKESSRLIIARGIGENDLVGFFIQPTMRTLQLPIPHRPLLQKIAVDQSRVRGIFQLDEELLIIPSVQDILL